MSDRWEHKGSADGLVGSILNAASFGLLGNEEYVENTETGDVRTVHVDSGQSVGDAISRGQFTDKDD